MRVKRGTLEAEKGEDGRTYVRLNGEPTQDEQQTQQPDHAPSEELVGALRSQVDDLREQLRAEREANRENRRLLAAALERIPELEAPPQSPQEAQVAGEASASYASEGAREETAEGGTEPQSEPSQDSERRPWWRRIFGG